MSQPSDRWKSGSANWQRSRIKSAHAQERVRSRRACDRCRLKKAKCEGIYPCTNCRVSDSVCIYSWIGKRRKKVKDNPMLEVAYEAIQRLYWASRTGSGFPGSIPLEVNGKVSTSAILHAMGLIVPRDNGSPQAVLSDDTDGEASESSKGSTEVKDSLLRPKPSWEDSPKDDNGASIHRSREQNRNDSQESSFRQAGGDAKMGKQRASCSYHSRFLSLRPLDKQTAEAQQPNQTRSHQQQHNQDQFGWPSPTSGNIQFIGDFGIFEQTFDMGPQFPLQMEALSAPWWPTPPSPLLHYLPPWMGTSSQPYQV